MKDVFETALWYAINIPKSAHNLNQSVSVNVCMAKMKEIEENNKESATITEEDIYACDNI